MDENKAEGSGETDPPKEITDSTCIITSTENANNENREIELRKEEGDEDTEGSTSNQGEIDQEPKDSPQMEAAHSTENKGSFQDYEEHVTYDSNNDAIYTDPASKVAYKWDKEKNEWKLFSEVNSAESGENESKTQTNPYENEHYRWCSLKNEWVLKNIENEHYRWCSETNKWIPKMAAGTEVKYLDGQHTYTDKDGTVFVWEKNAWFPKIDDDFMAIYQMNYGFIDNTNLDPVKPNTEALPQNSSAEPRNVSEGEDLVEEEGEAGEVEDQQQLKAKRKQEPPSKSASSN